MKRFVALFHTNVFVRNSVVLFTGTMASNLANYLFHFIMGRMVPAPVYGEMESIVSLLIIVSVPGAAIAMIATRYAAAAKAKESPAESRAVFSHINRGVSRFAIPAFILALILTPQAMDFLKVNHATPVLFLWGMMFLSFFSSVASGMLSGWQRFFAVGVTQTIGSIAKLAFAVLFVWLGFEISGIIGAFLLSSIIGYALSLLVIHRIDAVDRESAASDAPEPVMDFSSIRSYVVPALVTSLSVAMLGNADMVLAKYHLSPDEAGLYGALFIVSKTIFFAGGILSAVMFSMSSEEHEKIRENGGSTSSVLRHSLGLSVIFCIGSVTFFALFPDFILSIFFGNRYLIGSPYLGWFALAAGLYTLANFFLQYLLSIKRTTVAWVMLGIAILEAGAIFFVAKDMPDVIFATVLAQGLALLAGVIWYVKARKMRYTGQEARNTGVLFDVPL